MALLGGVSLLEWVCPCWSGCCLGVGVALLEWCGLVGGSISLGVGFETLLLVAAWKAVFWLPLDQDVKLSALAAPCLPARCHVSAMMIMD